MRGSSWISVVFTCVCLLGMGCSGDDSGSTPDDGGTDSGQSGAGGEGGGGGGGMGGSGGDAMTGEPDSGTDSATPDDCEGVDNPCTTVGKSCDGNNLITCEADADGCLVQTTTECDDYCDAAAKACASCDDLEDACDEGGASCDGDTLTVCATNADGCLVATSFDCTAGDLDYCDADAATPVCVDCEDLDNACTTVGVSCDGNTLVDCHQDANGCKVATETDCTDDGDNNVCDPDADPDAACAFDPCIDEDGETKANMCVIDEPSCSDDILVTCVDDADGCPIATQLDCTTDPGHNVCDDTLETPACAFNPCIGVSNCLVAGVTCKETSVITCAENIDGCLVQSAFDCTVGGTVAETCDVTAGPDFCTPCQDAAGCTAEGDSACDGNVFGTCSDTDGDSCLNLVEEDCGDDFACDDTEGCVYDGDDECVESPDEERVLRASGSYGPFTTVGETQSDFGPYTMCPGQLFTISAGSPDLLFPVDVPAQSVIDVGLVSPTGFTSNTWLYLLEGCAANAETMCLGYSGTNVGYTNTTDTTVRVYVVFDASTPTSGASSGMPSTGTFGLEVDTRPLACGDGKRDGDEECDDANVFEDDGCSPTCELEDGYACTNAEPSICTQRPTENVCGNVACASFMGAANGVTACCTTKAECGVAYTPYFGASCIKREPVRPNDTECPTETGLFVPALNGCCRADGKCGLVMTSAGCVERTAAWTALSDGFGSFLYGDGPFAEVACTP